MRRNSRSTTMAIRLSVLLEVLEDAPQLIDQDTIPVFEDAGINYVVLSENEADEYRYAEDSWLNGWDFMTSYHGYEVYSRPEQQLMAG